MAGGTSKVATHKSAATLCYILDSPGMEFARNVESADIIRAVKERPCLWNWNDEDYRNFPAKKRAWEGILRQFLPIFDRKTAVEKNNYVRAFQRRWKSLRDSYSRELLRRKKKDELGYPYYPCRKRYKYFNSLCFLRPFLKNPEPADPVWDSILEEPVEEQRERIQEPRTLSVSTLQNFDDSVKTEPAELLGVTESATQSSSNPKQNGPAPRKKPRRESSREQLLILTSDKTPQATLSLDQDDEDRFFLLSLVSEMRKVPDSMKFDVKFEIMEVFKKARSQYLSGDTAYEKRAQSVSLSDLENLEESLVNAPELKSEAHIPHQEDSNGSSASQEST